MHRVTNGTSVPKSVDSPDLPPNFKVRTRKKHPPVSITLTYVDFSMWHIQIQRIGQMPRNYYHAPNNKAFYPKQISLSSLLRFHLLFANLTVQEKVLIWPQLCGWMAFIDPKRYRVQTAGFAVYSLPSESDDDEPDIFKVFEELAKGKPPDDEPERCPYCGSEDCGASWVHDLHKVDDDQPDHYDCANCGRSWEGEPNV